MSDQAYKAAVMLAWPVVVLLVIVLIVPAMVLAWFFIPFARVERGEDGGMKLVFGSKE